MHRPGLMSPKLWQPWVLPLLPRQAPEWCSHTHHLRQRGWTLPGAGATNDKNYKKAQQDQGRPPLLLCLPAGHTMPQQQDMTYTPPAMCYRLLVAIMMPSLAEVSAINSFSASSSAAEPTAEGAARADWMSCRGSQNDTLGLVFHA